MKHNLNDIQVFYSFVYKSYASEGYYESVYYFLWQQYRTIVRDLYIGKYITYGDSRMMCTDVLSYHGKLIFQFEDSEGSVSLNVRDLKGVHFE